MTIEQLSKACSQVGAGYTVYFSPDNGTLIEIASLEVVNGNAIYTRTMRKGHQPMTRFYTLLLAGSVLGGCALGTAIDTSRVGMSASSTAIAGTSGGQTGTVWRSRKWMPMEPARSAWKCIP